ncbi:serine-threonine kinase receptor-associated protein-like [Chironomus tepperi]|uniref:serine-threonine kinase receptor-associated protein-like n=1 Tax=Chironomus tepperi TaxID=113505 RepID=UPI00391F9465
MPNIAKQLPITCSGHTRPVTDLVFSKAHLLSACKDKNPILRRADTGDLVGTLEGHKGAVFGVSLNSSSKLAATGAADFSAKIWDTGTGLEKYSFEHTHVVKSVAFSKDSKKLLTGSNEKLLKVFDIQQPSNEIIELYSGHAGYIKRAFFCREDKCIISCAEGDKRLKIWDRSCGKVIHSIEFFTYPCSIEISNDGKILTTTYGSTVSLYEIDKMTKIRDIEIPCKLECASLHPEKCLFVCGGEDFKAYKFDFQRGSELESHKGHFGPIHCISFSKDGELFASGSEDGTLRLWQTVPGKTYGSWKFVDGELKNKKILYL